MLIKKTACATRTLHFFSYVGGEYNLAKKEISPGFSIYRHGMDVVGLLCTNTKVFELRVRGQLKNNTWVNLGMMYSPKGSNAKGEIRVCMI